MPFLALCLLTRRSVVRIHPPQSNLTNGRATTSVARPFLILTHRV